MASSYLPFRKELVQSSLYFYGLLSLFDMLPQAFSPLSLGCLSPEVLLVSWSQGFTMSLSLAAKTTNKAPGVHSALNPQAAGTGPSVSALSQPAEAGRSESMREVSRQTRQYGETRSKWE